MSEDDLHYYTISTTEVASCTYGITAKSEDDARELLLAGEFSHTHFTDSHDDLEIVEVRREA